jgi:hypothetical protein
MRKNNFSRLITGFASFGLLFLAFPARAVCPVCTFAVGAGVGFSRYLGIEDTITGVWIGGLIMSVSFWTVSWFEKKNWRYKFRRLSIIAAYYLLVVAPLFWTGFIGHATNKLCGVDKLLLGIVLGSVGFSLGVYANKKLKEKNNDRVHFPFQKVVLSIAPLLILSLVFYIISKC